MTLTLWRASSPSWSKPYAVDVAHNPKDGLQALKTKNYDLLLLDVMMGRGAEGIMIARKLGKTRNCATCRC